MQKQEKLKSMTATSANSKFTRLTLMEQAGWGSGQNGGWRRPAAPTPTSRRVSATAPAPPDARPAHPPHGVAGPPARPPCGSFPPWENCRGLAPVHMAQRLESKPLARAAGTVQATNRGKAPRRPTRGECFMAYFPVPVTFVPDSGLNSLHVLSC